MKTASCFGPAHILLPGENIPLEKWGCVACDQFTSDRAYWEQADAAVGGCPSTLRLILPEVYLEDEDAAQRVENIHAAMDEYSRDVLTRAGDCFVYVERTEQSGRVRQGLVGKIDLEAYSYEKGARPAIRPSERTVTERIPPRMAVRRGAALETPHVMMLADDPGCTLVEPIGAHKSGRIGEDPNGIPGNLMPYITQVAIGKLECLNVCGNDYPTPDGTGVRDYIHVVDLALGHIKALDRLLKVKGCEVYNLGTGKGYSVLDVVKAFEKASGIKINYRIAPRRAGDVACCYADATKAKEVLGWQAKYDIDDMCADSWRWQSQNPNGLE